jgi:hypothetical protein
MSKCPESQKYSLFTGNDDLANREGHNGAPFGSSATTILDGSMDSVAARNIEPYCNIYCFFSLSLRFWRVLYMGGMN